MASVSWVLICIYQISVLIGYIYNNLSDETNDIPVNNVENGDYPHTCKVEIGEKTKEGTFK